MRFLGSILQIVVNSSSINSSLNDDRCCIFSSLASWIINFDWFCMFSIYRCFYIISMENYKIKFLLLYITMKIYLLALCCLFACIQARKLIMIQCITRHGVRYPQYPNEHDFSNITIAHDALKELTAEGRRMHFLLGRKLYQKYWNALFQGSQYEHQLNRSLIYAKSTDTNRTI